MKPRAGQPQNRSPCPRAPARPHVRLSDTPRTGRAAEDGGGFFAHRAFAVVRVVQKVAIDGHIKIFSLESWARQNIGTRDAPMLDAF